MGLNTFDIIVLAVMVGCIWLSTSRGMIAELFDFFGWIISLVLARAFSPVTAKIVFPTMQPESMGVLCAFVLIFVLTRILQNLLQYALNHFVKVSQLTTINRLLGGALGALKGLLFINLGVLACAFSDLPKSPDWQQARTSRFFERLVELEKGFLPEFMRNQVNFPERNGQNPTETEPKPKNKSPKPTQK